MRLDMMAHKKYFYNKYFQSLNKLPQLTTFYFAILTISHSILSFRLRPKSLKYHITIICVYNNYSFYNFIVFIKFANNFKMLFRDMLMFAIIKGSN